MTGKLSRPFVWKSWPPANNLAKQILFIKITIRIWKISRESAPRSSAILELEVMVIGSRPSFSDTTRHSVFSIFRSMLPTRNLSGISKIISKLFSFKVCVWSDTKPVHKAFWFWNNYLIFVLKKPNTIWAIRISSAVLRKKWEFQLWKPVQQFRTMFWNECLDAKQKNYRYQWTNYWLAQLYLYTCTVINDHRAVKLKIQFRHTRQ